MSFKIEHTHLHQVEVTQEQLDAIGLLGQLMIEKEDYAVATQWDGARGTTVYTFLTNSLLLVTLLQAAALGRWEDFYALQRDLDKEALDRRNALDKARHEAGAA